MDVNFETYAEIFSNGISAGFTMGCVFGAFLGIFLYLLIDWFLDKFFEIKENKKIKRSLKNLKNDPVFMAKMDAELQEYCREHNLEPIDINKHIKAGESDDD